MEQGEAKHDVNVSQLQLILERHRMDMNLQTAELLQELDFVESEQLKRLYNYNLASNRDVFEAQLDVMHEHEYLKTDPEMVKMWANMTKTMSVAAKQKREQMRKIAAAINPNGPEAGHGV